VIKCLLDLKLNGTFTKVHAVQNLDIAEPEQPPGRDTADAGEIAGIYQRLLTHGFQDHHIKEALQVTVPFSFLPGPSLNCCG
jgi:hypothetical protein